MSQSVNECREGNDDGDVRLLARSGGDAVTTERIAELRRQVAELRGALEQIALEAAPSGLDYGHGSILKIARAALASSSPAVTEKHLDGEDVMIGRRLLWLNHGCWSAALYGDDGKMDCNQCLIDFKTLPFAEIEERLIRIRRREYNDTMQASPAVAEPKSKWRDYVSSPEGRGEYANYEPAAPSEKHLDSVREAEREAERLRDLHRESNQIIEMICSGIAEITGYAGDKNPEGLADSVRAWRNRAEAAERQIALTAEATAKTGLRCHACGAAITLGDIRCEDENFCEACMDALLAANSPQASPSAPSEGEQSGDGVRLYYIQKSDA